MAIQGLRDTTNFVVDQRPKNWREGLLLLWPNGDMPLTALTSLMKKRETDDPEFNWWEKELSNRRFTLSANLESTGNATVSSNALQLKAGDILLVENTGELCLVAQDPVSDTSIVLQRSVGGVAATQVDFDGNGVNPNLRVVGSAYEEGSLAPSGISLNPVKSWNYTQIFRNTLEMTRTATKTRLRTGDQVKEAKRECLEMHGTSIEHALWDGERVETTRNGKPWRLCGGVHSFIPTENVKSANNVSGTDMETLEEWMYEMFRYGSSEKVGFTGNRALLTIQQIIRKNSSFEIMSGIKEYGMAVSRLISPFGELVLKRHPLWNQLQGGTTGSANYYGQEANLTVLDMKNIMYTHLKESDTKYESSLQAVGQDAMKAGYISEVGLEVHHPKTHFRIQNLATAAVDAT